MIAIEKRLELLDRLGKYMLSDDEQWIQVQDHAVRQNSWFTPEHVRLAVQQIAREYLNREALQEWISHYRLPEKPVKLGIVMAGNIPLVGFHDLLCGFVAGHLLYLKLSTKDDVLMRHLLTKLTEWEPAVGDQVQTAEQLRNCDAYIATGSNNTARYFEQYFAKYPHIIRRNRTSVAILEGDETDEELRLLGHDVFSYFGLGCRNVSQLCVPEGYDFSRLLELLKEYEDYMLHHKYKHNLDYHLTVYMMNGVPYLTNNSIILTENPLPFSAVSVLHYRYYKDMRQLAQELETSGAVQTIVGRGFTPFGAAQYPGLSDYADGMDTMAFLCSLK